MTREEIERNIRFYEKQTTYWKNVDKAAADADAKKLEELKKELKKLGA